MGSGHILKEMFVAFGKPIVGVLPQKRLDVYKNWAEKCDENQLKLLVDRAINYEERFPTIARMNVLLQQVNANKIHFSDSSVGSCYMCESTGFLPYMEEPKSDGEKDRYSIYNYACKCSKGDRISNPSNNFPKRIKKYFDFFDVLQFEDKRDKYPSHITYPLLVNMVTRENNQILLKQI